MMIKRRLQRISTRCAGFHAGGCPAEAESGRERKTTLVPARISAPPVNLSFIREIKTFRWPTISKLRGFSAWARPKNQQ